ncbi:MAG: GNAT family N-acetyltransferase [Candidatus Omnitrophica bacterium]|nr:GNAT family N-acetyltransferase [Candidatus Omnitrophota bacterium]
MLNLVSEKDCRDLWLWRNHPDVRKGCFRNECIDWQGHKQWFYSKIKNKNIRIYIASKGKDKIGVIRFRKLKDFVKVSVNLNPESFGKGLGTNIIRLGTEKILEDKKFHKPIIAEIRLDNIISQKAFYKAGYKHVKTLRDKVIYQK